MALPGVPEAEEDTLAKLSAEPGYTTAPWHLENTGQGIELEDGGGTPGVDIGWRTSVEHAKGDGIVVAVIDTGIELDHPDLAGAIWSNPGESCDSGVDGSATGFVDDCPGWNFVDDTSYVSTGDTLHSTHVSATIAASLSSGLTSGVAPEVTIMPLQGADGGSFPSSRIAAAVDYAVAQGADIINLSVASEPGAPASTAVTTAVEAADAAGVLLVASPGNDRADINTEPVWPASYAATYDNVIAVAATDRDDRLAGFLNQGSGTAEVAAPGDLNVQLRGSSSAGEAFGITLGTWADDGVYAVVEHDVTLGIDEATHPGQTGGAGQLPVPELSSDQLDQLATAQGVTLELSTNLPEGHYGLLAELPSSPDAATALFFEVSAPSPPGSGGEEPEEEDEEEQGGTSPPPTGSPLSPSSGPTSGGTVVTIPIEHQDG